MYKQNERIITEWHRFDLAEARRVRDRLRSEQRRNRIGTLPTMLFTTFQYAQDTERSENEGN